jgi:hypothetical protein
VACVTGLAAEDCAAEHWCLPLGGQRERAGWRATCPLCQSPRAIEYDAPGRNVRWQHWCPCEKQAVREALADRISCLPRRAGRRQAIDHDALIALALDTSLPPLTLRLRVMEMAGMPTTEALGKLGVRKDNRARVIQGRTGGASNWTRSRRS